MFARELLLLLAELSLYFGVLVTLLSLRKRLGIGLFVTALGAMHFLETYLAASLYIRMPGGLTISPGSSILFSGKLVLILLVYIKDGAFIARQPIYGLLVGNLLTVALLWLVRMHDVPPSAAGRADIRFLDQMGWLMVWGTALLYVDAIAIILLYERLGGWLRNRLALRLFVSLAAILSFDQLGFFAGLQLMVGVPAEGLLGGWIAKLGAAACYACLAASFLWFWEAGRRSRHMGSQLKDVFEILTYRERYHALLAQSGRDALTGALNRSRLETQGRQAVDLALASGQAASVLAIDMDRLKDLNDRYGHEAGDAALRAMVDALRLRLRPSDYLFRFGCDSFLICSTGPEARYARQLAETVAATMAGVSVSGHGRTTSLSASVGLAVGPEDGATFKALFERADLNLYAAKREGRRSRYPGTNPFAALPRNACPEVISVGTRPAA
jgi:diguanylate cyclase (GGDEF)-like protein